MKARSAATATSATIAPGNGIAEASASWQPIAESSLLILVGVTGAGKSTTVDAMHNAGIRFTLLPNRRALTDQLIISEMQRLDGSTITQVTDRQARFDYTRRYRERFPGGMAHALGQLQISPGPHDGLLLFDGLRGVNEVSHAATHLPAARFIVLDAPDSVRVQRLLGRNDAFDQVESPQTGMEPGVMNDFAALGVPAARELFSPADEAALFNLVNNGAVTADGLAAKLRIVVAERRNYDPAAAISTLRDLAPSRTIVIDTVKMSPNEAAKRIAAFVVDG